MGRNARLKREKREARWKKEAQQEAVRKSVENTDVGKMTDDEIKKFIVEKLKDPIGFDYFVGKALKTQDRAMLEVLNDFKMYGTIPEFKISRGKDGQVLDVETSNQKQKPEELPETPQETK